MMDRKEKNRLKAEIGKHIDLSNGRFTDSEVSQLHDLVEKRNSYDGRSQTYRSSYKGFDFEGTYRVEDTDTYTLRSDDDGIRVEHEHVCHWDDGQHDVAHEIISTARSILNSLGKLKL